jgi:hypothetical protein
MSATKFHTHTKQEAKLYFCISQSVHFWVANWKTKVSTLTRQVPLKVWVLLINSTYLYTVNSNSNNNNNNNINNFARHLQQHFLTSIIHKQNNTLYRWRKKTKARYYIFNQGWTVIITNINGWKILRWQEQFYVSFSEATFKAICIVNTFVRILIYHLQNWHMIFYNFRIFTTNNKSHFYSVSVPFINIDSTKGCQTLKNCVIFKH